MLYYTIRWRKEKRDAILKNMPSASAAHSHAASGPARDADKLPELMTGPVGGT